MPDFPTLLALLVWSIWGCTVLHDHRTRERAVYWYWKVALILICGPAVWGIALYRALKTARHAVLSHYGVQHCGCQCHSHHHPRHS